MPIPANRKKSDATLARQALLETPLVFSGFTEYTNPAQQEAILGVLGSEIALRVIPSVSRELDYPKTAICLIEKTISVVRGVKQLVIRFRSHFNRTFNEELKQAGDASFDYGSKTWRLVMTPDSIERIQSVLCHYFILVIEVGREVVMQANGSNHDHFTVKRLLLNNNVPAKEAELQSAFSALPYHVAVSLKTIEAEAARVRPKDSPEKWYVHNGQRYVPLKSDVFWTRFPFLVFRYGVSNSMPRYVIYSTIGQKIEQISFQENKITKRMLARFVDTCQSLRIAPVETDESLLIPETEAGRSRLHGDFSRYQDDMDEINRCIAGLCFAPLLSDYVTLATPEYGADIKDTDTVAYVNWGNPVPHAILRYFGFPEDAYPVIFSRTRLEEMSRLDFCAVVAHELAHHLVRDASVALINEDSHGVFWSIMNDILSFVLCGQPNGEYLRYNPKGVKENEAIHEVLERIAFPCLLNPVEPLNKEFIISLAVQCFDRRGEMA